jgi:AcrR family transcriptional regulator
MLRNPLMAPSSPLPPSLRADAARNRESLLEVATRAFAASDDKPSMRAIAREAGVGIGTLYRHFPTRESLVEAIYQDQAERLTAGARDLLAVLPPAQAMRRWMDLFGEWLATKRGIIGTLAAPAAGGERGHPHSRAQMLAAITAILDAGAANGDIRATVDPEDVVASLVGIFLVAGGPAQQAQAGRLLDLLMDGLRPPGT